MKLLLAKLACDRAEHTRSDRRSVVLDQHRCVLVKADIGSVLAANFLFRSHDDGVVNLSFLCGAIGNASLTVTLILSPRRAILLVEPPIGMIITTRFAPELSATAKEVCI